MDDSVLIDRSYYVTFVSDAKAEQSGQLKLLAAGQLDLIHDFFRALPFRANISARRASEQKPPS